MNKDEIQAMKDKIDHESRYINLVNQNMNNNDGVNLWFLGLIIFGIIIGFFIGRI